MTDFVGSIWFCNMTLVPIFQACNGDVYLKIPTSDLAFLAQRKVELVTKSGGVEPAMAANRDSPEKTEPLAKEHPGLCGDEMSSGLDQVKGQMDADTVLRLKSHGVNYDTVTVFSTSAVIQTETVPDAMFTKHDMFFCCACCGKIFWDGSHFERVCEQFSHVLNIEPSGLTVYDKVKENWG